MGACLRKRRGVLGLAATGWLVLSLWGCSRSAIDAERANFAAAPAAAARAAVETRLALDRSRAYGGLNVAAGAEPRPAGSSGAYYDSYQRWSTDKVRELPKSVTTTGQ
ncbi:MAG: hypothetical protein OXF11_15020 [Deltaproteobacteria bacterium]|nr:hypothetical protein [Deltaproteobacteria bacterium]